MKLLIISDMPHYYRDGQIVGWGPTVEEINHLSQLFCQVEHIGFLYRSTAPLSAIPYSSDSVRFLGVEPTGGNSIRDKAGIIRRMPSYFSMISRKLRSADVVHLRCPANINLVSLAILAFRRRPALRWFKYAGEWNGRAFEPIFYRLQRLWLRRRWSGGIVTMNGLEQAHLPHVRTFYNPCLTNEDIIQGRRLSAVKSSPDPMRVVFVGALNENKGVLRALEILNRVRSSGVRIKVDIVGDGPQRHTLEQAIQAADWGPDLVVHGWLPKGAIGQIYGQSHLILMTSKTEGWPKVLSEAMAYGVVPVASAISCIPDWLKEFGCGESIDSADYNGFANSILSFVRDLDRLKAHSAKAIAAAERFTYDNYIIAVQKLLQLKS